MLGFNLIHASKKGPWRVKAIEQDDANCREQIW